MYIFLDIDGVLNKKDDWKKMYSINRECILSFAKLIKKVKNPKIVLTSSWRDGWDEDTSQNTPQIKSLSTIFANMGTSIIGKTKHSPDKDRSKEINNYIKWHDKDDYIIIDDDTDEFKSPIHHLYIVNSVNGITDNDVKLICKKYI